MQSSGLREESKKVVKDIFQDSVTDDNRFFSQQLPTDNTLQRQPKVDFNLDGDDAEDALYAMGSKKNSVNSAGDPNRLSIGSNQNTQ